MRDKPAAQLNPNGAVPQPILLVGISARLLAELATEAGYQAVALDYFGDLDLRARCESLSLKRDFGAQAYSANALAEAARSLAAPAVVYGASFENHPHLVAELAAGRQLLGNPPETVARVRDPFTLAVVLREGGYHFPATYPPGQLPPAAGRRWLWKPLASGGGHAVRAWHGGPLPPGGVLQERLRGLVGSAIFVADGRQARLLGLTEQLVGLRAFGASGFRYCGNLCPPRLPAAELQPLARQARAVIAHLTAHFGLRGLNGIDFVWHAQRLWTIEVNPRPTAALEVLSAEQPANLFSDHVAGCLGVLPAPPPRTRRRAPALGKAVIFAAADQRVGSSGGWVGRGWRDIPHPGEAIGRGHPICTVLARATTPSACLVALRRQAAAVRRELQ